MACNCCGPTGCKCKFLDDPNSEVPSYTTNTFSYNFNYKMAPWVHRDYPEPMFMTTWDAESGSYLASNHIKKDGKLLYYGDFSNYSRKGIPLIGGNGYYTIEDGNGDNSIRFTTIDNPPQDMTAFTLEEKQDAIKKECQLWVKFKRITNFINNNGLWDQQEGPWSEEEMLHSIKWNEPAPAQFIVTIPGNRFNGPTSVELKYTCFNPCIYSVNNYANWEISGQADWVNTSTIEFPLDRCKSYGKFNGTVEFRQTNCNNQPGVVVTKTNNRSKMIFFDSYSSCGYQYGFHCSFFGINNGGNCLGVPEPCVIPFNDPWYCCGNIFGGYTIQPDGTEVCGRMSQIGPYSFYTDDPYNREIINGKTVKFNGTWANAPEKYVSIFDCSTGIQNVDPTTIYKAGTIVATGV